MMQTTTHAALLAAAAARTLPAAADGWSVDDAEGEPVVPGAAAIAAAMEAHDGTRLVVAVAEAPADDPVAALAPALSAMAAELLAEHGAVYDWSAPTAVDPATAFQPGPGQTVAAAALRDGNTHAATIALISNSQPASHEFAPVPEPKASPVRSGLELLHDVEMGVTAELGRTRMLVREILALAPGSVIELDRTADSPVDVLVNGTLIARGEVVVIDEEFGIRITEVIGYGDGTRNP